MNTSTLASATPYRQIRARYDAETITVYQAYRPEIAEAAVRAGRFVSPFSRNRMTWIKPSFLWMMYRCGWATKPGQERVLAIRITRAGFEKALEHSCLSHFDPDIHDSRESWQVLKKTSPVRIQWDPERDTDLNPLAYRSLQVGIGPDMVNAYADDWITGLDDITSTVARLRESPSRSALDLPPERPYPLPEHIARRIGATVPSLESGAEGDDIGQRER